MRQKTSRSTIKEVALAAGVSTQTVSRVINERPDVSPETRKRVQGVIDHLAYRPSAVARSLIRQRSHTLGIVTAGLKYIGPSRILSGIASAVEEAGYSLLLKELSYFDTKEIEPIFEAFLSRHVDGIIWAVPEVGDNRTWVKEMSLDLEVPLVYLTMQPQDNVSVVSVDNYLGGKMAVLHLLEQGFKNVGHISGPLDWWEARQRRAAWKDVLNENGITVEDEHSVEGDWSLSSGIEATERLINQYPEMDSIFVANDQMALSAIQYLRQHGLRVPEDIGIVGFDDIPESAFFWPPLTTIKQDQHNMAHVAVKEMIKIIESGWQNLEPIEPKTIMLPPKLIVRQSSVRI